MFCTTFVKQWTFVEIIIPVGMALSLQVVTGLTRSFGVSCKFISAGSRCLLTCTVVSCITTCMIMKLVHLILSTIFKILFVVSHVIVICSQPQITQTMKGTEWPCVLMCH